MTNTTANNSQNTTVRASITLDQARAFVRAFGNNTWEHVTTDTIDISMGDHAENKPAFVLIDVLGVRMPLDAHDVLILSDGLNFFATDYTTVIPISDLYIYDVRVWDPITGYNQTEYTRYSESDARECVDNLRDGVHWAIVGRVNPMLDDDNEPIVIDEGIRHTD